MVVIVAKEKSMERLNLLVMGTNGVKIIHIMVSLPCRFLISSHHCCLRVLQGKQAYDTRRMSSSNRSCIYITPNRIFYNRTYRFYFHRNKTIGKRPRYTMEFTTFLFSQLHFVKSTLTINICTIISTCLHLSCKL